MQTVCRPNCSYGSGWLFNFWWVESSWVHKLVGRVGSSQLKDVHVQLWIMSSRIHIIVFKTYILHCWKCWPDVLTRPGHWTFWNTNTLNIWWVCYMCGPLNFDPIRTGQNRWPEQPVTTRDGSILSVSYRVGVFGNEFSIYFRVGMKWNISYFSIILHISSIYCCTLASCFWVNCDWNGNEKITKNKRKTNSMICWLTYADRSFCQQKSMESEHWGRRQKNRKISSILRASPVF